MEPETDKRMKLTGCHTLMLVAFPGLSGLVTMVARLRRPQSEGPNQRPPEGTHWLREKEGKKFIATKVEAFQIHSIHCLFNSGEWFSIYLEGYFLGIPCTWSCVKMKPSLF